jgi:hypothetical protein
MAKKEETKCKKEKAQGKDKRIMCMKAKDKKEKIWF